ncbi:MAG TPA: hydroxysqualene dehydroxylase HpnE [Candidatus Kapabacteria bacterium]|nr:hydroxysqualene dehydroxylase HpnE [Candidatus Kapabacteria bacterium]
MKRKVIIVGAGIAGINAAIILAKAGIEVRLFEAKKNIGGRCFSFTDNSTGDVIDNGQHIFIGAYNNFFDLLRNLNTFDLLKPQSNFEINYIDKKGSDKLATNLSCGKLPLALALFNFRKLDFKSKISIVLLILKINNVRIDNEISCLDFLRQNLQTELAIKYFWEPLILATLNQSVEKSPASIFVQVIKIMFQNVQNAKIYFSSVPLSKLIEPAHYLLQKYNSEIITNTEITKLDVVNKIIANCYDKVGQEYNADAYILALSFDRLARVFSNSGISADFQTYFEFSPIISLYIWTKTKLDCSEINALVGTQSHWLFDLTKIYNSVSSGYSLYTVTISNAKELCRLPHSEISKTIIEELNYLGLIRKTEDIVHTKLIVDKKATVSIDIANSKKRLPIETAYANLFICGDWVSTSLPATLESAALSGKLAAERAISYFKST